MLVDAVAKEGLVVEGLSVRYKLPGSFVGARRQLAAVSDVSLDVQPGETLGVVGESGCGKSSLARALVRLAPVSAGRVLWRGDDLTDLDDQAFGRMRPQIQMVFQDPFAALNPRMRMFDILSEPLITHFPKMTAAERRQRVLETVEQVGLGAEMIDRFPHEFSGGQAQRIGIGRAIISRPKLLICDEAVSALDVSVQALILKLLRQLQVDLGLAILFISHDLAVVRQMAHRVLVLYLGRMMEYAPRDLFFAQPRHPYSQALMASALSSNPDKERARGLPDIGGDLPSPLSPPSGCPFRTRCPKAAPKCAEEMPLATALMPMHQVACHFPD